jgi:hypothetical protein
VPPADLSRAPTGAGTLPFTQHLFVFLVAKSPRLRSLHSAFHNPHSAIESLVRFGLAAAHRAFTAGRFELDRRVTDAKTFAEVMVDPR